MGFGDAFDGDELAESNLTSAPTGTPTIAPKAVARVTYLCNTLLSCFITHMQHAV